MYVHKYFFKCVSCTKSLETTKYLSKGNLINEDSYKYIGEYYVKILNVYFM